MKTSHEDEDITGEIGPLYTSYYHDGKISNDPKHKMLSFQRPANSFWQGFYNSLRKKRLTHDEAIEELQSTGTRHFLDNFDNEIEKLGMKAGRLYRPVLK